MNRILIRTSICGRAAHGGRASCVLARCPTTGRSARSTLSCSLGASVESTYLLLLLLQRLMAVKEWSSHYVKSQKPCARRQEFHFVDRLNQGCILSRPRKWGNHFEKADTIISVAGPPATAAPGTGTSNVVLAVRRRSYEGKREFFFLFISKEISSWIRFFFILFLLFIEEKCCNVSPLFSVCCLFCAKLAYVEI